MPRINPDAPETGMIVGQFTGLKNTLNPERLGEKDLVRALNIDLDDAGQISRRRGYTKKLHGNVHSPFTTQSGQVLVVKDGALGVLHPDYSFQEIVSGIASDPATGVPPLAYAQVGNNVYYSGLANNGVIDMIALTRSAWGQDEDYILSPVPDPTASLPAIAPRILRKPPLATQLAYFNGRIYLANGYQVWATELYSYNWVDANAGYKMFEAPVTMIGSVGDGIYVGTEEGLWFLSGSNWREMKRTRVMDSAVVPGSMVLIPSELGNPSQIPPGTDTPLQVALAFMTANGWCVASDGGTTYNMTETKVFMPPATSAAAMYRRMDGFNAYVANMQSGGDPTESGKVGDFVEATIIRGAKNGAWIIVPPETAKISDTLTPSWPPSGGGTVSVKDTFLLTWVHA